MESTKRNLFDIYDDATPVKSTNEMAEDKQQFLSTTPMGGEGTTEEEIREPRASHSNGSTSRGETGLCGARNAMHQPDGCEEDVDENENRMNAQRDEEESLALARALMAEEAMAASYVLSVDYLRNNRDQFSEEDLAALQAAMDEDEPIEEEGEMDDSAMSYELMLRLGERLGDVKSERWAMVAHDKIKELPTFHFDQKKVTDKEENDCEVKCLICQCQYEENELLRRLPCGHCFHADCVDQWLMSKDCCPYCRGPIVQNGA